MKKELSLDEMLKKANKSYGANTIMKSNSKDILDIDTFSTGCHTLDYVFGKGMPVGRIVEIHGLESSGKSTMAAHIVSEVQKKEGKVLWVDAEFSFSKEYYSDIGVKIDDSLYISQPETGEEAFDIIIDAVKTKEFDLIVVDSVSSLVPKAELEGEIDKASVALQARMMSKALRMLTGSVSTSKTTIIFINQLRDNIGVYFGNKTTTSGGKALRFYASVRLEVRKGKKILGAKEEVIGNEMHLCAVKNKVAPPFRKGKIELLYAKGIDVNSDLFDIAVENGIIKKSGITFSFKNKELGVGRKIAIETLNTDKALLKKVDAAVLKYNKDI